MFSPFYFVFGPIAAFLIGAVGFLFFSISSEKDSELRKRSWHCKSDLEIAQEMERQEEAELMKYSASPADKVG